MAKDTTPLVFLYFILPGGVRHFVKLGSAEEINNIIRYSSKGTKYAVCDYFGEILSVGKTEDKMGLTYFTKDNLTEYCKPIPPAIQFIEEKIKEALAETKASKQQS